MSSDWRRVVPLRVRVLRVSPNAEQPMDMKHSEDSISQRRSIRPAIVGSRRTRVQTHSADQQRDGGSGVLNTIDSVANVRLQPQLTRDHEIDMQCRSKKRRRSPSSLDDDAVDLSGEDDMRGSASDHQQLNAPESPRPESEHGQQTLNNLEAFTLPDVFFSVAEFLMPFDHLSSSQVCKGWFQLLTEQRWLVKARVYFRQWVPYWTHQQNELRFPTKDYQSRQPHFSRALRRTLIGWMSEILDLLTQPLRLTYLLRCRTRATRLLDRAMQNLAPVQQSEFLRLGALIIMFALREEESSQAAQDFLPTLVHLGVLGEADIQALPALEKKVLFALDYQIAMPTVAPFLEFFCRTPELGLVDCPKAQHIALYLAELAQLDYRLMPAYASNLAVCCCIIALFMVGRPIHLLMVYSGYYPPDLLPCVDALIALVQHTPDETNTLAVKRRYSTEQMSFASTLPLPDPSVLIRMLTAPDQVENGKKTESAGDGATVPMSS